MASKCGCGGGDGGGGDGGGGDGGGGCGGVSRRPWVLADNDAEMAALAAAGANRDGAKQPSVAGMTPGVEWHVGSEVRRLTARPTSTLHCMAGKRERGTSTTHTTTTTITTTTCVSRLHLSGLFS